MINTAGPRVASYIKSNQVADSTFEQEAVSEMDGPFEVEADTR